MDKRQFRLLGIGVALAIAAIATGAAQRSIKAREQAVAEAAEQAEYEKSLQPTPLPRPDGALRRESVGGLELRVSADEVGRLFTPDGAEVATVRGFQAARAVPGQKLFGSPAVEMVGKSCVDPCNPTFVLVASPGGSPRAVLQAQGVVKLEDLDGDGVPEALVDHLVRRTQEVVTLPYALVQERFVPAAPRFRDGIDRQTGELSRAARQLCTSSVEGECRDTLLALFALQLFAEGGELRALVDRLEVDEQVKAWARDPALQRELRDELNELVR